MCVFLVRASLARSSGRISSTEAPVVPIAFATTAPMPRIAVLSSGVPESEPLTWIPPVITKSAASRTMKDAYSSAFSSRVSKPALPKASTRYAAMGAPKHEATTALFRLRSHQCPAKSGSTAIARRSPAKGARLQRESSTPRCSEACCPRAARSGAASRSASACAAIMFPLPRNQQPCRSPERAEHPTRAEP